MAVTPIGQKELALRAMRGEVQRRYRRANKREAPHTINAIALVKQAQAQQEAAVAHHVTAAARAEQGQIRIAELEAEVRQLKKALASRDKPAVVSRDILAVGSAPRNVPRTCPVCEARRLAAAAKKRQQRAGKR